MPSSCITWAANLHDHMAAAAANVDPDTAGAPFLERSVHYDNLSAAAAAELAGIARGGGAADAAGGEPRRPGAGRGG